MEPMPPENSKFYGNVMGIPVGSPDDDPHTVELFPDGDGCVGYMRRCLPSEMALGRMINPPRMDREDGYLPSPPPEMTLSSVSQVDVSAERYRRRRRVYDHLLEKESEDRMRQRAFRITEGNATGSFTGPPDRVRRQR
jgi:hypothetical protein